MGEVYITRRGGSNPLNFDVVGNPQPTNPKDNTIWVNTDQKITSRHLGADEPNVYDVKLSFEGNNAWIDAPHQLSVGDILNFVIPGTHYNPLEDINIRDVITGKTYAIRDLDGTAVGEWTAGIKVGVKISNNIHPIGNHSGYHGSAYLVSWGSYYHEEGTVWFPTGTSSPVAFNVLKKKNGIMVYPLSAKQYLSGAWVEKTAKTYQNGGWQDWWNGELFDNGEQHERFTGGWEIARDANATYEISTVLKYHYPGGGTFTAIYTAKKIDLTNYKTLRGECVITKGANAYQRFGVFHSIPTVSNASTAWSTYVDAATGSLSVDISSLTGEFYVGFGCMYYGGAQFTKIWLE